MAGAQTDPRLWTEPSDESAFVRQLADFDPDAWRGIFQRYFTPVFRLAYVRTLNRSAAEDITAEVFSEAALSIRRYKYRGVPFRAWLFRIARNVIADHLKAQKRRPQVYFDAIEDVAGELDTDIELRADFVSALGHLTDAQRDVVILRFVTGCSLGEVADVMGKSVGAIKQLQSRAVTILQAEMRPDGGAL
jgi:RNA polymerase sigma-70 factor (ECF subfamily)